MTLVRENVAYWADLLHACVARRSVFGCCQPWGLPWSEFSEAAGLEAQQCSGCMCIRREALHCL